MAVVAKRRENAGDDPAAFFCLARHGRGHRIEFTMKMTARKILLPLILVATSLASGAGMPPMDVTVSAEGGKLVYKGKTTAAGTFATGTVEPGKYVVQFNSNNPALKGSQFGFVISAGKAKVLAEAVSGNKLGAGVAMKVDAGRGVNITGQVMNGKVGGPVAASGNTKVKIIKGKRYVWVGPETGSNMGGHWVEEGSAAAGNVHRLGPEGVQNLQDRGSQGGVPGN